MRLRSTLTTALALAALTATPSLAAGKVPPKRPVAKPAAGLATAKPLTWTDPAGDANGLNPQGGLVPGIPNDTTTPGSIASDDIVAVTLARTDDGKVVTGLQATMKLSAPPAAGALYRISGAATGCTTFWFQYSWTVGGSPVATLRHNCGVAAGATGAVGGSTVTVPVSASVNGSSLIWTLKLSELPSGLKLGSSLSPNVGEVRAIVGAAGTSLLTAPTIDQTAVQTASYKIGD